MTSEFTIKDPNNPDVFAHIVANERPRGITAALYPDDHGNFVINGKRVHPHNTTWKGPRNVPKKSPKAAERRRVKLARRQNRGTYNG